MKAEEQEQMKKLLSEERKQVSPDRNIKIKLDQAFEAKYAKRSVIPLWATYPLPAWQVAATVALLIIAGIALEKYNGEKPAPEIIALTDTVYVERIIPGKTDTVIIEREKRNETEREGKREGGKEILESPAAPAMMSPDLHISDFHNLQPNGSTLSEDSAAQNWMVKIL